MTSSVRCIFNKSRNRKDINGIVDLSTQSPDGGWGWVVCFGAFMVNFIADGTMFSFGIIFIDLLEYFQESKFKTSIVGSSQLGLSMMMGPVVSILLKKFSIRQVMIGGGLIASVSMMLSVYSPNIEIMIFTYGILCGTGICMLYMPSIIAVGLYFNKKRAIATGIATSGAGVGVFVYGYLMEYLLKSYGWKGTVMVLSAIMLNGVVCGALFRPITPLLVMDTAVDINCSSGSSGYGGSSEEPHESGPHDELEDAGVIKIESNEDHLKHNLLVGHTKFHTIQKPKFTSSDDVSLLNVRDGNPRLYLSSHAVGKDTPDTKQERIALGLLHPMLRKDIYYSGSISHLPDYNTCGGSLNSFLAQMTRDQSGSELHNNESKSYFDLSLLKDKIFWCLLIVCIFWTVQSIPMIYVPSLAVSRGIHRSQAALLISIVGIANTVGRIMAGFLNDVFKIRSIVLYFIAFCLGATVNFLLPFCATFPLITACTSGFGICMAVAVSMRTIVIADLMNIDRLTQSFGFISFAQGAAFIFNPPIAGTLMDLTGTYTSPFFMTAIFYLLSGCLCLVIIIVRRNS